jgi:hypothetical protein
MGKDIDMLSIKRRDVSLRAFPRTGIDISASTMGADMLNSDGTMNLVGVLMLNSASKIGADIDMLSIKRRDVSLRAFPMTAGKDISASRIGADMLNSKIGADIDMLSIKRRRMKLGLASSMLATTTTVEARRRNFILSR